jgi:Outer membrane protein beta-barrel domain
VVRSVLVSVFLCLAMCASNAFAQPPRPIGPFVVDARATFARFKAISSVASDLNVTSDNLPTRGLGIDAGVHWYPLKGRHITLGIGGELVAARGKRTTETTGTTTPTATVTTRFSSLSPQLSLNFGTGDGWSYISGGIGVARLTTERNDAPFADEAGGVRATNYGGGARWFTGPHIAFTFDVRFYTVSAQPAQGTRPPYSRARFVAISAGVSFR